MGENQSAEVGQCIALEEKVQCLQSFRIAAGKNPVLSRGVSISSHFVSGRKRVFWKWADEMQPELSGFEISNGLPPHPGGMAKRDGQIQNIRMRTTASRTMHKHPANVSGQALFSEVIDTMHF